ALYSRSRAQNPGYLKCDRYIQQALCIAILNDYTLYQEEPGNAYLEALPPLSQPRLFLAYIGSQEEPGNQLTSY
ncbi:hypothetical protein QUA40_05420, partial [Microcoleus sp. Pol11C3]|uniref:hypothetical protein n=1 Tax=Microcoleus sp. Pol11C3 TaxID=3055390 RepID=UPI002FD4D2AE